MGHCPYGGWSCNCSMWGAGFRFQDFGVEGLAHGSRVGDLRLPEGPSTQQSLSVHCKCKLISNAQAPKMRVSEESRFVGSALQQPL